MVQPEGTLEISQVCVNSRPEIGKGCARSHGTSVAKAGLEPIVILAAASLLGSSRHEGLRNLLRSKHLHGVTRMTWRHPILGLIPL